MQQRIARLWPSRRKTAEPGAALFARLRLNLTLWYTGILAVALVVFGIGLFTTVSQVLTQPVDAAVQDFAGNIVHDWQYSEARACEGQGDRPPPQDVGKPLTQEALYIACFDATGNLITARSSFGSLTATPQGFPDTALAKTALTGGTAKQIVSSNGAAIYITATQVYDATGTQLLGVLEIGRSVEDLQNALVVLRNVLLLFGAITLGLAAFGGLFLANRALVPTRLAFARQQGFIANVSHELRTPLALLRADADVLLQNRDIYPPEDAELLDDIVQETEHMTTMTTNMLALARLDAGQSHLEQEIVDLSVLVGALVRRATALAQAKNIALDTTATEQTLVIGDRQLLSQVVLILLDNALKYTPSGGSVSIGTQSVGDNAIIRVQDSGIGVSPEHLARLGERFYRTDAARNRDVGGAGLGLSLALGIASAHKGTLTFASPPGHGLTAILALPRVRQQNRTLQKL